MSKKEITLDQNTASIKYLCQKDKRLAKIISMVGPITYSIHEDPYVFVIHEIIEQMLSVKVANIIYNRLVDLCDGRISVASISKLTDSEIKSIGTATSKVQFIRNFTNVIACNPHFFDKIEELSNEEVFKTLIAIKGIGPWTAKMYLIFVLDRQDILPYEDVAFLQAYGWAYKTSDLSPAAIRKKCKKWHPYSSVAARYMYKALDLGFTKEEFHLFKRLSGGHNETILQNSRG